MKTFKTTITTMKYFMMALLISLSVSCTGEDGMDGSDGMDGIAGQDGVDGQDGQDGQDGNANVQNITFDATSFEGTFDSVQISEITADVLANDVVLAYLEFGSNSDIWFPAPCPADSFQFDHAVDVNYNVGEVTFDYSDGEGNNVDITAGTLGRGRVVIIESTISSRTITQQSVLVELRNAGVDIRDYHAVCDYFNISY